MRGRSRFSRMRAILCLPYYFSPWVEVPQATLLPQATLEPEGVVVPQATLVPQATEEPHATELSQIAAPVEVFWRVVVPHATEVFHVGLLNQINDGFATT